MKVMKLLIVGTKPISGRGGISTAMEGYLEGLSEIDFEWEYINSHVGQSGITGFIKNWFFGIVRLITTIQRLKKQKITPVVWLHTGSWLSTFRKFTFALCGRVLGAKIVIHIHSQANLNFLNHPVKRVLLKLALSPAHTLFVLTPWWQRKVLSYFPRVEIGVIPNPISQKLLSFASSPADKKKVKLSKTIVAMSRLVPGKGFEQTIAALTFLNDSYLLVIAGDGPLLHTLQQQVNDLGLNNRVEFVGWVNSDEKIELLSSADIFCLPSKNDSFGMVFIEAMACHLPVVALEYGAIPDVIEDNVSGLLCKNDTPETLANMIEEAFSKKDLLIQGGLKTIQQCYAPKVVALKVRDLVGKIQ